MSDEGSGQGDRGQVWVGTHRSSSSLWLSASTSFVASASSAPRHSERLLAHCARSSKRVGVLLLRDRLGGLGELSAEGRELRGVLRAEGVELRVCCLVRGVRERESKAGQ